MNEYSTDIAIIGAGPSGLFSVFEAGMLKMKCSVIDSLDFIGGQCTALYPEKPIFDIPGYPEIEAATLIDKLSEQAAPFKPIYHLSQTVEKLYNTEEGFKLHTSTNNIINANSVIIAAGCGAFGPNRPPIDNIEQYENKSVFYSVTNKSNFTDKILVIAGGGDSAIDWTINLANTAKKIYLIHRRPKFRCAPESLDKVNQLVLEGRVEMVIPYQLNSLCGHNGYINEVIVSDLEGKKISLQADYLLAFFGLSMELGPITNWGLGIDKHHITVNPATMQTNHNGIYAIGDIIDYPGKLKLILSGFAEAAMATYAIYPRVYPHSALHFEYSTTKGIVAA